VIFPPTVEGKRKRVGRVREGREKTVGALSGFSRPSCIAFNSIAFNSTVFEFIQPDTTAFTVNRIEPNLEFPNCAEVLSEKVIQ
jgi:hypothetical protein